MIFIVKVVIWRYYCLIEVTTVEGVITRCIAGLEQDQVLRRIQHPDVAKQIDDFIEKLNKLKDLEKPFTLVCFLSIVFKYKYAGYLKRKSRF